MKETLEQWNLPDNNLVAATTDNARYIVLAIDMLNWQHFSCIAHTLQLGVQKVMAIPQVTKALAHARRLVSHFTHSSKSSYVMKPIVHITKVIGGEQSVTLSAVRPLLHILLSQHLVEKPSDAHLAKAMKKAFLTDLQGRYNDAAALLNKACFLDPRFKALTFLSEEQKETTVAAIQREVQDLASSQELSESPKKNKRRKKRIALCHC